MSTSTETRPRQESASTEARSKSTTRDAMRTFNPDRRWWHPLVAAMWLYNMAFIPMLGISPWWMLAVGGASTVAAVWAAGRHYSESEYGESQHKHAVRLTWITGIFGTFWLVYAGFTSPLSLPALGALILIVLVMGSFYAAIRTQAPARKFEREQEREQAREQLEEVQKQRAANVWEQILERAGCPGMEVIDKLNTKAGFTLIIRDNPEKPIKIAGLRAACGNIASIAAHTLSDQGIRLREDQVTADISDAAHILKLHVSTKNRFAESMAFPMDQPVSSIKQPISPAAYEDGEDVELTMLGTHTLMIGATGSGKDVFTNNCIARITRCNDALVWVGGTDKLLPLVWPWLAPLFRKMGIKRPVLDWVAGEHPQAVLRQMATLYKAMKLRNKRLGPLSKFSPSPDDPALIMVLTEASDLFMTHAREKVRTFDGHWMTASQLLDAITRAARSAGISFYLATQYGLFDALGEWGSFARRNITQRIAGKTYTQSDGTSTLVGMDGVDTTKLTDYSLLIQPSVSAPRAMKSKAYELDGEHQIAPVSIRNSSNQPTLPTWMVEELGEDYANRWNPEMLPELADLVEALGLQWPTSIPSEGSGTVEQHATHTDAQPAADGTESTTTSGQLVKTEMAFVSDEEIDTMLSEAHEKIDKTLASIKEHGALGPVMKPIYEKVMAANAPDWIPAWLLAVVTDRISQDAPAEKMGAAVNELVDALRAKPWHLEPATRDGDLGWQKLDIISAVRKFLTGGGTIPQPRPEDGVPVGEAVPVEAPPTLPQDTVALLDVLSETPLETIGNDGEWVASDVLLAAVAPRLDWPINTEGGRRLSAALAPVDVESQRPSVSGRKVTCYPADALRSAVRTHHKG